MFCFIYKENDLTYYISFSYGLFMQVTSDFLTKLKQGSRAFIIDNQGRDHEIPLDIIDVYIAKQEETVKVEGLEKVLTEYNRCSTIHCFIAAVGSYSFPEHSEPYPTEIICVSGTKTIVIDGIEHTLQEGQSILMRADTPHYATNRYDSIILSLGYD